MASSTSLRLAPPAHYPSSRAQTSFSAPSAPGLHDTFRANTLGLTSSTQRQTQAHNLPIGITLKSTHPLERRLALFPFTAQSLQYTLLRRTYGLAAPLSREMELMSVREGDACRPSVLRNGPGMGLGSVGGGWGRSVHEEVLLGRDWEVDGWEDIYGGSDPFAPMEDFHTEMETRAGW